MNRREFSRSLALTACAFSLAQTSGAQRKRAPQISITMDDFSWNNPTRLNGAERNQAILKTLSNHSIKAGLFVVGGNIVRDEGKQLLSQWSDAGHLIANHTYSHRNFNAPTETVESFGNDILRAEVLLKEFAGFRKYFRFPMLKEGDTAAKRDGLRQFLSQHDYRMGYVSIDTSDWLIDQKMVERLKQNPSVELGRYRDYYLEHMWDRAQYYDSLANRVVGRSVRHTILTHFNLLNALFLDELIAMFKSKGWQFIDAQEAYSDSVFTATPKILPAGESIVWALAKEKGIIGKTARYPAEDGEIERARMTKLGL